MTIATLSGQALCAASVSLPAWGLWWADVELADPTLPALPEGPSVLTIGTAVMQCAIVSGGVLEGRALYRVVAGSGGWRREVKPAAYADDAGVKAMTVAGDAATAAGEVLAPLSPTERVGPHFARARGPAAAALHAIAPQSWYVDDAGVTHVRALRPSLPYAGDASVVDADAAMRTVTLSCSDPVGLVPGVVVPGYDAALDVEWTLGGHDLTARLYMGAGSRSRRLDAFARIVAAVDPRARFRGLWEYRLVAQTGDVLMLQPARVATGMPDLQRVPYRPGPGLAAMMRPGALLLVGFADGDPARPNVVAFAAPSDPAWAPLSITIGGAATASIDIGGPGGLPVARVTDLVVAGPFGGSITTGSARVKAAL